MSFRYDRAMEVCTLSLESRDAAIQATLKVFHQSSPIGKAFPTARSQMATIRGLNI
jgi:hypothetical protein